MSAFTFPASDISAFAEWLRKQPEFSHVFMCAKSKGSEPMIRAHFVEFGHPLLVYYRADSKASVRQRDAIWVRRFQRRFSRTAVQKAARVAEAREQQAHERRIAFGLVAPLDKSALAPRLIIPAPSADEIAARALFFELSNADALAEADARAKAREQARQAVQQKQDDRRRVKQVRFMSRRLRTRARA